MDKIDFQALEKILPYQFDRIDWLHEAMCHSSFVNEQMDPQLRDNERLEFLGDAVLNLAIGHLLMQRFPHLNEGDLSRIRANLVNENQLADIARSLDLGRYIQLGRGEEQTRGREKNSILADTFEAVVAAIYLDGGFEAAFQFIERQFAELMSNADIKTTRLDYKSTLQEIVQRKKGDMPIYRVVDETGPDHDKTFRVQLDLSEITTQGVGKTKKTAEQEAAKKALAQLQQFPSNMEENAPEKERNGPAQGKSRE
jgi:ribonuclease-3